MSDFKKKRNIQLVLIGGFILTFILVILLNLQAEFDDVIVPFSGLPKRQHNIILNIIWPLVGSLIFVIVFPRIFGPMFLKIKKIIWKDYEHAYIDIEIEPLTYRKFLERSLFVFLLTMGFAGTIISILGIEWLLTPGEIADYNTRGIPIIYSMDVLGGLNSLFIPIYIGIWAISWALEDSGLIHFSIPGTKDKYYEIEPLFYKFTTYLSGFAGLTAIFYYLGAVTFYLTVTQHLGEILISLLTFVSFVINTGPAYVLYSKKNLNYLRKGLKKAKIINNSDLSLTESGL